MEALNPLSPNTAAFLDSLTYDQLNAAGNNDMPTALPPSTFFPVPGRDTPEDSSPDSLKPKRENSQNSQLSDDSDNEMGGARLPNHKRKASGENNLHDDDEDEDSLSDTAHDDKREKKTTPRRKSAGQMREDNKGKSSNDKKDSTTTKAQRRKEQNRAAQKAFRERREQKVRDLEAKVAELEAKSFGASVENDNLRNILKRLQEENVALKQAAFTFTMPVNGQPSSGTGQQTPTQQTSTQQTQNPSSGIDWSQFASFKAPPNNAKPPSPPQSVSNDSLRSVNDISPHLQAHRNSGSNASPESLASIGPTPSSDASRMPSLFSNGNSNQHQPPIQRHSSSGVSPHDQLSTPSSIGGSNKDDIEALFRSLYPNGIDSVLASMSNPNNNGNGVNNNAQSPIAAMQNQMPQYTFLTPNQGLTSYADSSSNALAKLFGDATSYRDGANGLNNSTNNAVNMNTNNKNSGSGPLTSQQQWADLNDNSVNDFLASLSGGNQSTDSGPDLMGGADDEAFSRQLEALIAQSGGVSPESSFNLAPNSTFSPTNYLNMSPSPLRSVSNSQSPHSGTGTDATSPQSDTKSPSSASVNGTCQSNVIRVVSEDGRVMRPSEVWTRMGMHDSDPQDLLIDDLCDEMRSKATCKDGQRFMNYDDVKGMMAHRQQSRDAEKVKKESPQQTDDPLLDPELVCKKNANGHYDPVECQAKLNEAFLKKNGLAV